MAEVGSGKRSYLAGFLSLILPGFGQLYLRKPGKMLLILVGVTAGVGIVYANSLPVQTWRDLKPRIEPSEGGQKHEYTVWQFEDGRQLRFRPRRVFQLTGWVQTLVFWLYGVIDGWIGRRGYPRPKKPDKTET